MAKKSVQAPGDFPFAWRGGKVLSCRKHLQFNREACSESPHGSVQPGRGGEDFAEHVEQLPGCSCSVSAPRVEEASRRYPGM